MGNLIWEPELLKTGGGHCCALLYKTKTLASVGLQQASPQLRHLLYPSCICFFIPPPPPPPNRCAWHVQSGCGSHGNAGGGAGGGQPDG